MRELHPDEILAIAGGLPPVAALDESSYRIPAEPLRDPVAGAAGSPEASARPAAD